MKYLLFLLIGCASLLRTMAQEEEPPAVINPQIKINSNRVYGKIVDSKTGRSLDAITVQLYAIVPGAGATKDSLVGSMFTLANGDFSFSNLPAADSFRLRISAVGFAAQQIVVPFNAGHNMGQRATNSIEKDMGNITLEVDVQVLSGVTVTAQRPTLQMGIDRKVFNVDQSLTATGGTAIDVMKNIPSVSVDVDGNVQLRNSTPQIFVDGLPTILTLDQIPADNIERVELITNPSARFDAASTGGIINVILKKNKRVGFNGVASAGAGHPDIVNGSINLNARQGKFNFFVSGGYNQSGGRATGSTFRQNKEAGRITDYFNRYSTTNRLRRFSSVRFGLDYFLDNRNTVSISQGIVDGRFTNNEEQQQEYLNQNKIMDRTGERFSDNTSGFKRYNSGLNFTHKFPQAGKELSANINYNYGSGTNETAIINRFFGLGGTELGSAARVRNSGSNDNDQLTVEVNYVQPKGEDTKLETGVRSYINKQHSLFSAFSMNNGVETKLPLSNNYLYRELVNAFYLTYSNKWKSIAYQAGLRAEHSQFDGELVDSAQKFGYSYPKGMDRIFDALFPSLFLTKEIGEGKEVQLNYTRRIRRPNFWQLNPFIDINDPVNISQGNPMLEPEFTNSLELNYSQQYKKGNFLGVVYYRNNQNDITRFSDTISRAQYGQLNNAAIDSNAILNTFINIRSTNRVGAEFTLQHKFTKNFVVTPTIDMQYRMVNADQDAMDLSNKGFSWEGKLITSYKIETEKPSLWNNLNFQVIGEYESPEVTPQGRNREEYSVDFALRKEFLKDKKASFTFSINDVFNTQRFGSIYDTDNFFQDTYSRRNVRSFRVNLTYKFGNANFSLFRRNDEGRNGDDD
jgi:outer membrane receptor protein involved in Fe transport